MTELLVTLEPVRGKDRNYHSAMFCMSCGKIWARLLRPGSRYWVSFNRSCSACPQAWFNELPGSLADPYDAPFTGGYEELPLDALVREMELLAALDSSTVSVHTMASVSQEHLSMELTHRIAELRAKVLAGTVTKEELREACAALRSARTSASEVREQRKTAAAKPDGAAILAKLQGLTK